MSFCILLVYRYLLCGETVVNTSGNSSSSDNSSSFSEEPGPSSSLCASPSSSPGKSSKMVNIKPYIFSISKEEFHDTLTCFMRVSWAATAGKLQLANNSCPIREGSTYHLSGRSSRQSSSGWYISNSSSVIFIGVLLICQQWNSYTWIFSIVFDNPEVHFPNVLASSDFIVVEDMFLNKV